MADNKKKQGYQDDIQINILDPSELQYAANESNCSVEEIVDAIKKIGRYRKDVRWFIKNRTTKIIDLDKGIHSVMAIFRNSHGELESQFFINIEEAKIYLSGFVDKNKPIGIYNVDTGIMIHYK